jgi:hypothetical protein
LFNCFFSRNRHSYPQNTAGEAGADLLQHRIFREPVLDFSSTDATFYRVPAYNTPGLIPAHGKEGWTASELPSQETWKTAGRRIGRKILLDNPQLHTKYATWFETMPVTGVYRRDNDVCVQYACSNTHRRKEVERLLPIVAPLLANEVFPGTRVTIELLSPPDPEPESPAGKPTPVLVAEAASSSQEKVQTDQVETSPLEPDPRKTQPMKLASATDAEQFAYYRQRLGLEISDEDLQAVLHNLSVTRPADLRRLEGERLGGQTSTKKPRSQETLNQLDSILVEPSYQTAYDEIVRSHSAVYLPAYFVRHLRHMGAANGLRYLALSQIAYLHGHNSHQGTHPILATTQELCRWSTLQPRRIMGDLEEPNSYLFLLAGKMNYHDYYRTRPEASRWEDASGYHWRNGRREYCVWKKDDAPTNDCSQLTYDPVTGGPQWRQAPAVYRVQLSMPLCPEDEARLRSYLRSYGVRTDPLGAIRQCMEQPRDSLIPDMPEPIDPLPRKLYTVQELVMEEWGSPGDHSLTAQVAVQSKVLETHLVRADRDLLKIPFYLLQKWGPRLSPAQMWTAILLTDRVYAAPADGEYRDTTLILGGIKEMTLWTEDTYTKGASRKISKWLYPFEAGSEKGEHFNPWFSVFASEVLPENGSRKRNADNTMQMRLRVLPLVPLAPEDTLTFARKMGLERISVRDASGRMLAIEITPEEMVVYLQSGRTLRYSYEGELRFGGEDPIQIAVNGKNLEGIQLFSSETFYDEVAWPGAFFGQLENRSSAFFGNLENGASVSFGNLEKSSGAFFGVLDLDSSALFGVLLKLLILNLYGIQKSSDSEIPPSQPQPEENVDSLEQFGARQGHFIQWTEETTDSDWIFENLAKTFGITDTQGLRSAKVSSEALVGTALELYATPNEKFKTSRIAVLVSKLRINAVPPTGAYQRLAELGPLEIQSFLRRAILGFSAVIGDPDWDHAMGTARRDDLIDLAERLGVARVFRLTEN